MGKGLAGTALGLSIGAILIGWFPILGWLFAMAALVVAIIAVVKCKTPEEGKGMAIAGLVMSVMAIILIPVMLMAIGAMAYFGVMEPDKFLPAKCKMSPGFSCTDFALNDGLMLVVTNNVGADVEGFEMSVSGDCTDKAPLGTFRSGETKTITLCAGQALPAPFSGQLRMGYTLAGAQRTADGSVYLKS